MLFNDTVFCKRPVLIYFHAWELFMFLFSSADFVQNEVFTNKPPRITIGVSNSSDPDQVQRSSSGFKLFAEGYWQTTKFSTGMQRVITGKYFSVQYIIQYKNCMYMYTINIRTL